VSNLTQTLFGLLPVSTLTLMQFISGKAIRFVVFFAALPALFGLIYVIGDIIDPPEVFLGDVMLNTVFGTLLPIASLVLATSAFQDEIDDRTMVYLIIKPISRFRIVAEKYLAVTESTILALWLGAIATWAIASGGDMPDTVQVLMASLVAILVGVTAYSARALVVGILYTLIWESLLSRFIPGVWTLSVRHYVESVFVRLNNDSAVTVDNAVQLYAAFPAVLAIIVASLGLATWRLRTMDFE
jgi:ABC-2 type transport system permease protein